MDDEALRKLAETLIDESFDAWIWILNEAQRGNQENALRLLKEWAQPQSDVQISVLEYWMKNAKEVKEKASAYRMRWKEARAQEMAAALIAEEEKMMKAAYKELQIYKRQVKQAKPRAKQQQTTAESTTDKDIATVSQASLDTASQANSPAPPPQAPQNAGQGTGKNAKKKKRLKQSQAESTTDKDTAALSHPKPPQASLDTASQADSPAPPPQAPQNAGQGTGKNARKKAARRLENTSEIMNTLQTLVKKVDGLQNAVNGLQTAVNGLQTAVNGLDTRVNGLDTSVNGLDTRVNGLETKMDGALRELKTATDRLSGRVENVSGWTYELRVASILPSLPNMGEFVFGPQMFTETECAQAFRKLSDLYSYPRELMEAAQVPPFFKVVLSARTKSIEFNLIARRAGRIVSPPIFAEVTAKKFPQDEADYERNAIRRHTMLYKLAQLERQVAFVSLHFNTTPRLVALCCPHINSAEFFKNFIQSQASSFPLLNKLVKNDAVRFLQYGRTLLY